METNTLIFELASLAAICFFIWLVFGRDDQ